jgi:hypothetical protein
MRGEHEPARGGQSEADGGSVAEVRVEPIPPIRPMQPGARGASHPTANASVPDWTQRLSLRGKLGRALGQWVFALYLGGTLTSCGYHCISTEYPVGSLLDAWLSALAEGYGTRLAVVGLGRSSSRRSAIGCSLRLRAPRQSERDLFRDLTKMV